MLMHRDQKQPLTYHDVPQFDIHDVLFVSKSKLNVLTGSERRQLGLSKRPVSKFAGLQWVKQLPVVVDV